MKLFGTFGKQKAIGIDVGRRTLKGISLLPGKNGLALDDYFFEDLAAANEVFPENPNSPKALEAAVQVHQLGKGKVAAALPDYLSSGFEFQLPPMPDKELRSVLEHELTQRLEYPIADAVFDFYPVERSITPNATSKTIKVFCVKKGEVTKNTEILSRANLQLVQLDLSITAIAAMLEYNEYTAEGANFVIMDIGESHMTTALVVDTQVLFYTSAPLGVGSINEALKSEMNLSYLACEELKRQLNLVANPAELDGPMRRVDDIYIKILSSAQQNIDYFLAQSKEFPISHIFLTGGGTALPEIATIFEGHYKIKTLIPNPFRKIDLFQKEWPNQTMNFDQLAPFMAVAVGLALGRVA